MRRMAGNTIFVHCRPVREFGVFDDGVDIFMTPQAELARLLFDHVGKICRMWGMATVTLTLGHRFMGADTLIRLLDRFMAGGTECTARVICFEKFVLLGPV